MNKNIAGVSILQASKLCGLSVHMITYFGRIDVLKPTIGGQGRQRLYSFNDVAFLRVISDPLSKGIEVKRLGEALRRARAQSATWLTSKRPPDNTGYGRNGALHSP